MGTKNRGGNFHPSRVSGHQKFLRAKEANEAPKKKRAKIKPLNLSKSDWSLNKLKKLSMKIKLETTPVIREINENICILRDNLPKIVSQRFWQRQVSVAEKSEYMRQLATFRANLWQEVESKYPELKGKNYSITTSFIIYEADDLITPPPPGI